MSDSEDEMVAVDVDEDDQSDNGNNNGNSSGEEEEEELVVVAEAVDVEEESDNEAAAIEVEFEEYDDDENVALVVEEYDDRNEEEEDEEIVEVAADDGEYAQPQIVVMEEEEGNGEALVVEAEAVAVAVDEEDDDDDVIEPPPKRSKTNEGKAKAKSAPKKRAASSRSSAAAAERAAAAKKKKVPATKKASTTKGKSKKGGKASKASSSSSTDMHFARIDSRRMNAANAARENLYETVQKMPFPVSTHPGDSFSVRSFGQLKVATKTGTNTNNYSNKFCTSAALYPIGFSCDRIEFSPSHGRFLKLRCAILDGTRVGINGPLFRVMWGQGIDEDKDKVEYPYDPFSNSAPITGSGGGDEKGDDDADDVVVAIPTSAGYQPSSTQLAPAVGMRIKTRFDKDKFYYGTITAVTTTEPQTGASYGNNKGKKQSSSSKTSSNDKKKIDVIVTIRYDDGSAELTTFPDPDINLVMPGNDDEVDENGSYILTELNGKPVCTVTGQTPIEAWSMALIKLGLIDEEIATRAMKALEESIKEKAAVEGRGNKKKGKGGDDEKMDLYLLMEEFEKDQEHPDALDSDAESYTEEEMLLKERVAALKLEYARVDNEDEDAATALIDTRVELMGPMATNPFPNSEISTSNQASFLGVAVRKEKTKMGSTGNKRKIVLPTDLLSKNDTFVNPDIEALLEGLPGSEYCTDYVFLKRRGEKEKEVKQTKPSVSAKSVKSAKSAANERLKSAKLKEQQKKAEREREVEKAKRVKQIREAKAREKEMIEREIKRKKVQDERDAKKKQRLDEEEKLRKKRAEERMSKLSIQVDDRLKKEACFQREKVILIMAKNLSKEMSRRRKAAEIVAGQIVSETKSLSPTLPESLPNLPHALGKQYDEDILRMWDYLNVFKQFFVDRDYFKEHPSLDRLQDTIDVLRGASVKGGPSKAESIKFVTELAVSLCKPLAAGLSRMLFASLIALNPSLQKQFNAAFWTEEGDIKNSESDGELMTAFTTEVILPVNEMTWTEIARVAFLNDALGELGYSRQETAHIIRGYRSTGHPNSKEAKRLGKVQDMDIALLRQNISDFRGSDDGTFSNKIVRLAMPSKPQSEPSDWMFYLHNVKSLKSRDISKIRKNLKKALKLLGEGNDDDSKENFVKILEKSLSKVTSKDRDKDSMDGKKARELALGVLDKATGEVYSRKIIGANVDRDVKTEGAPSEGLDSMLQRSCQRSKMGELEVLQFSKSRKKELAHIREDYMEDALKLKEVMKRQEMKEAGEYDDYDDDDDDDDDENGDKVDSVQPKTPERSMAKKEMNETIEAPVNNEHNTDKVDIEAEPEEAGKVDSEDGEEAEESNPADTGKSPANSNSVKSPTGTEKVQPTGPIKIGKETGHDDFCGDIPEAPELIRRCLAVLRALVQSGPADPFLLPVNPHTNPGYYDVLVRPMCMRSAGLKLKAAAKRFAKLEYETAEKFVESTVAQFARNIRLIVSNTLSYANAGPIIVSAGAEMLRVFERLLLDWVLAPADKVPALDMLDDDLCVEPDPSDIDSTVLLCDSCEGNYNVMRLDPPLYDIPKGDWYCPRCLSGRWWGDLDPRIGRTITLEEDTRSITGEIKKCRFSHPETTNRSLIYEVETADGETKMLPLDIIDGAFSKIDNPPPRIRCLEAVTESTGYSSGVDNSYRRDLVPVLVNPNISDGAAQVFLSSSVFRESVSTAATLMINDCEELTASEWLRLLTLLMMRCSSSDLFQTFAGKMENESNEQMVKEVKLLKEKDTSSKLCTFKKALFSLPFETGEDDDDEEVDNIDEEETPNPYESLGSSLFEKDSGDEPKQREVEEPKAVVVSSSAEIKDLKPTVVVGENAVQVVATEVDGAPGKADVAVVEATTPLTEEEIFRKARTSSLREKSKRQRAREDCITAFCIKNQLKSTVAAFEEDNVSQAIESSMASKLPGLSFGSTRCRGKTCELCGLSDTALGTNLVRMPNQKEWDALIQHAARSRRTHLLADLRDEEGSASVQRSRGSKKLMKISVRIGDDLISAEPDEESFTGIKDGGMLEFLPRNPEGFQQELLFRYESNLPYVSGSMIAHEGCAAAAHKARKEKVIEGFKEKQAFTAEREAGIRCGRSLELGTDSVGRSFWHFYNDLESLHVCEPLPDGSGKWHKFSEPEVISSIIVSLSKDPIVRELKNAFPNSVKLIRNKTWSELLMKRHFKLPMSSDSSDMDIDRKERKSTKNDEAPHSSDDEESYEEGEDVLVESTCGNRLWDARIIGVSRCADSNKARDVSYRVSYKSWSSRFDEWVSGDRVVEPSENNTEVQAEMLEDAIASHNGLPPSLDDLEAKAYLNSKDRLRGFLPLPPFAQIMATTPHTSASEKIFAKMKAALLAIEGALPIGSINNTAKGQWRPEFANQWRLHTLHAKGPWDLMRCVILLEQNLNDEWIHPDIGNMYTGLPLPMKALEEASPSSLALRILLLDKSLVYSRVDKKRYKPSKSKK